VDDLAQRNPEELLLQLRALHQNVRLEEVKVWIRQAKRIQARSREELFMFGQNPIS
jgi:hypothetical protein